MTEPTKSAAKGLLFVLWVNLMAFCFLLASRGCQ